MVMQIFQMRLSLDATKNIFINSLQWLLFGWGVWGKIWKKGAEITLLSTSEEKKKKKKKKKTLIQDSDVLANSVEWIHDPILVEYSRVHGTDPGFSTAKSFNSFSIRKTKGKLLKAAQSFLNSTGATVDSFVLLFLGSRECDKRRTNSFFLKNKCPAKAD